MNIAGATRTRPPRRGHAMGTRSVVAWCCVVLQLLFSTSSSKRTSVVQGTTTPTTAFVVSVISRRSPAQRATGAKKNKLSIGGGHYGPTAAAASFAPAGVRVWNPPPLFQSPKGDGVSENSNANPNPTTMISSLSSLLGLSNNNNNNNNNSGNKQEDMEKDSTAMLVNEDSTIDSSNDNSAADASLEENPNDDNTVAAAAATETSATPDLSLFAASTTGTEAARKALQEKWQLLVTDRDRLQTELNRLQHQLQRVDSQHKTALSKQQQLLLLEQERRRAEADAASVRFHKFQADARRELQRTIHTHEEQVQKILQEHNLERADLLNQLESLQYQWEELNTVQRSLQDELATLKRNQSSLRKLVQTGMTLIQTRVQRQWKNPFSKRKGKRSSSSSSSSSGIPFLKKRTGSNDTESLSDDTYSSINDGDDPEDDEGDTNDDDGTVDIPASFGGNGKHGGGNSDTSTKRP